LIDTHCHLLPGVDDGPRTELDSIAIARRMHEEGVVTAVCTPHFSTRYASSVKTCESRLGRLRDALADLEIPLELYLAAEISPAMALDAPSDEILRRNLGGRYVVIELERNTRASSIDDVLARLEGLNLVPVLAHPERCHAVRRSSDVLSAARDRGALVQVVAPSLAGGWGSEARIAAWRLVEDEMADLVASDAHTARGAATLAATARLISDRYGEPRRHELFEHVPACLISGSTPMRVAAR
jgi:protein-tyrosine phosphatase